MVANIKANIYRKATLYKKKDITLMRNANLTLLVLALYSFCNAQKFDLRFNLVSEHYYVQNFDLSSFDNISSSYFTSLPSPRIGIGLGMKFKGRSEIALDYSFGAVNSSADLYTDESVVVGKYLLREWSSQINLSYAYKIAISDKIRIYPTIAFTIHRSLYDYRKQSLLSGLTNASDINFQVQYVAINFWDYYSSLGFGSIFQYDLDERYSVSLNVLYHKAWLQYLLRAIGGSFTEEKSQNINTTLIRTPGTRLHSSITFYCKIGKLKK